jgi:hypothetical protein
LRGERMRQGRQRFWRGTLGHAAHCDRIVGGPADTVHTPCSNLPKFAR